MSFSGIRIFLLAEVLDLSRHRKLYKSKDTATEHEQSTNQMHIDNNYTDNTDMVI